MFEHRFRGHRPVSVTASPAGGPVVAPFMAAPTSPAMPAMMAEVYRLAYEAAIARIIARRRCFAPFSVN